MHTPRERRPSSRSCAALCAALNKNAPAVACARSNGSHKNRLHVQLDAARRVQHWCQCGTLNVRKPCSWAAAAGVRPPLSKWQALSLNALCNATAARLPNIFARPRQVMLQDTLRTDRGKIGWRRNPGNQPTDHSAHCHSKPHAARNSQPKRVRSPRRKPPCTPF
ncbi:hypothetical protein PHLGIDRAFT_237210 [Phlebiopsis gigantea 11061_1 CR5-6]|uniref:Uncharacterized protein n=1 Tax=Phlebiopsis gigantea (strain 11061_1 CR5-6) TaxID=745531 RepID=A0A0C3PDR8_PHLG1|nr:hypothetical protein PHLGIDRAFT_237210 [Phlebiopsis gigantea 11061_1 CR5-6]